MKAFVSSQFQYCPLVWMFHSRKVNHKIKRIQERALRIVYKDYDLDLLATKIFKTVKAMNPSFINDIFVGRTVTYNLRKKYDFVQSNTHTAIYCLESIYHRGDNSLAKPSIRI